MVVLLFLFSGVANKSFTHVYSILRIVQYCITLERSPKPSAETQELLYTYHRAIYSVKAVRVLMQWYQLQEHSFLDKDFIFL